LGELQGLIDEIFRSIEQAIGVHVTLLVVERAVWKTKGKYEEASYITFSEDGICLDQLEKVAPDRAKEVTQEFVSCFVATLGRLVGRQLALQLTEQLQDENITARGAE